MGGFGSWLLMDKYPKLFAAGVPICGGGKATSAKNLVDIPIWAFHGEKDRVVHVERGREMIEAIKKAGGKPRYSELPGVRHNSWTPAYKNPELWKWLFAQKKKKVKSL